MLINYLLAASDPLEEIVAHKMFYIGPIAVTNHMIMAGVAAVLMLWIFPRLWSRPDGGVPTGAKNFFEAILEYLRNDVFRPALKEYTDVFTPFLWTLFFFIFFCNFLGIIPFGAFIELITWGHITHMGGAATASISTTATLAVCAFFFIHFHGIDTVANSLINGTYGQHGHHPRGDAAEPEDPDDPEHKHHAKEHHDAPGPRMTPGEALLLAVPLYLWNFAPHPFRPQEGESKVKWFADVPMFLFLLLLELLGAVIKPFALCMRLFANMVAGHAVMAVLISLIIMAPGLWQLAVGVPAGLMDFGIWCLEIFVAVLHAYIFTFLTTLFLAGAIAPEH